VVQGFLVGVPFVGEIHYGFFFAEAVGLKSSNLMGKDGTRRGMVNDLLLGGKNTADPLCGFSF